MKKIFSRFFLGFLTVLFCFAIFFTPVGATESGDSLKVGDEHPSETPVEVKLLTDKNTYLMGDEVNFKVQVSKDENPLSNTPVDLELRSQEGVLQHVVVLTDSYGYAKGALTASSSGVLFVRAVVSHSDDLVEILVSNKPQTSQTKESPLTLTSSKNSYVFGEDVELTVRYKPAVYVNVVVINARGSLVSRENVMTDYLGYASVVIQPEPGSYYVSAITSDGTSEKISVKVFARPQDVSLGKSVVHVGHVGISSVNESEAVTPYVITMVKNKYYVGPGSILRAWVSVVDSNLRPVSGATVQLKVSYDTAGNQTLAGSVMNLTTNDIGNANFSYTIPSNVSTAYIYVHAKVGNTTMYESVYAQRTITVTASTDKSVYGLNETVSLSATVDGPEYTYGTPDPLLDASVMAQILGPQASAGNATTVQLTDSNNITNVSIDIINAKISSSSLYFYVNYTSGSLSSVNVKLYDPNGTQAQGYYSTTCYSGYSCSVHVSYWDYPGYVIPSGEWNVELTGSGSSYSVPVQVTSSYDAQPILSESSLDDSDNDAVYTGSYTTPAHPSQLGVYTVSVVAAKGNLTNGTDTSSFDVRVDDTRVYTNRETTSYTPLYGFGNTITIRASVNDTKTGNPVPNANVTAYVKSPGYTTVNTTSVAVLNNSVNASYTFLVNKTRLNSVAVNVAYNFLGSYQSSITAYLLDENGTVKDSGTVYDGYYVTLACDSTNYYEPCNLSTGTWQVLLVSDGYSPFNNTPVNLSITFNGYFDWNVALSYASGLYSGTMQTPDPSVLATKNVEGTYSVDLLVRDSRGYNITDTTEFLAFLDNASLSVGQSTYLPNDTVTITAVLEDMASLAGATGANVSANVTSDYGAIQESSGSFVVNSSIASRNVSFNVPANTTGTKMEVTAGFGTSWSYSNYRNIKW